MERPAPADLAADHLVAVLGAFCDLCSIYAEDLRAGALLNEGRLPHPKEEVLNSICVYLGLQSDPNRADAVENLALTLGSFQTGIGTDILLPKEESLRRRVAGPMQAKDFSDMYARVDDDAERYAVLHPRVHAERAVIRERCRRARAEASELAMIVDSTKKRR